MNRWSFFAPYPPLLTCLPVSGLCLALPTIPALPTCPACLLKLAPLGSNAVGRWDLLLPCNDSCPIHSHSRSIVTAIRPPREVPAASVLNVLARRNAIHLLGNNTEEMPSPLGLCCPIDALRFIASLGNYPIMFPAIFTHLTSTLPRLPDCQTAPVQRQTSARLRAPGTGPSPQPD